MAWAPAAALFWDLGPALASCCGADLPDHMVSPWEAASTLLERGVCLTDLLGTKVDKKWGVGKGINVRQLEPSAVNTLLPVRPLTLGDRKRGNVNKQPPPQARPIVDERVDTLDLQSVRRRASCR